MIEPAIYQLLSADVQLGALISADSIYLIEKPASKNTQHYIIQYSLDERRPLNIDLSRDGRQASYRIQCYSSSAQRSRDMADRVDALFNGQSFTVDGIEIERIFVGSMFPTLEKHGEGAAPLHCVNISLTIYYH